MSLGSASRPNVSAPEHCSRVGFRISVHTTSPATSVPSIVCAQNPSHTRGGGACSFPTNRTTTFPATAFDVAIQKLEVFQKWKPGLSRSPGPQEAPDFQSGERRLQAREKQPCLALGFQPWPLSPISPLVYEPGRSANRHLLLSHCSAHNLCVVMRLPHKPRHPTRGGVRTPFPKWESVAQPFWLCPRLGQREESDAAKEE
jgi:hypothetical protein